MNDDFNEQPSSTRVRQITSFKWTKAGLNGHYTDIPGRTEQIWCMFHPRKPGLTFWQICDSIRDKVFVEGIIEITDVLDMRQQAEKIVTQWISDG